MITPREIGSLRLTGDRFVAKIRCRVMSGRLHQAARSAMVRSALGDGGASGSSSASLAAGGSAGGYPSGKWRGLVDNGRVMRRRRHKRIGALRQIGARPPRRRFGCQRDPLRTCRISVWAPRTARAHRRESPHGAMRMRAAPCCRTWAGQGHRALGCRRYPLRTWFFLPPLAGGASSGAEASGTGAISEA